VLIPVSVAVINRDYQSPWMEGWSNAGSFHVKIGVHLYRREANTVKFLGQEHLETVWIQGDSNLELIPLFLSYNGPVNNHLLLLHVLFIL
jgi:hypothetical protein